MAGLQVHEISESRVWLGHYDKSPVSDCGRNRHGLMAWPSFGAGHYRVARNASVVGARSTTLARTTRRRLDEPGACYRIEAQAKVVFLDETAQLNGRFARDWVGQ